MRMILIDGVSMLIWYIRLGRWKVMVVILILVIWVMCKLGSLRKLVINGICFRLRIGLRIVGIRVWLGRIWKIYMSRFLINIWWILSHVSTMNKHQIDSLPMLCINWQDQNVWYTLTNTFTSISHQISMPY